MKTSFVCLSIFVVGAFAAPNVPGGRILGGGAAERGQFPYQVSIQYCLQNSCQHACGGAIIDSLWVLSGAHCITQAPALGSYQVIAGILNLDDVNDERQLVQVNYVVINPDYEGGINPHDIAIFRLATPLNFNTQVKAIYLPEEDQEFDGNVTVSGWGSTTGTQVPTMPNTLQYINTTLIDPESCKAALDSVLGGAEHPLDLETNVCTGPLTGGVSICTGDSGGPIVDSSGTTLVGIASWTVTPCGTVGGPSVHIRVSRYTPWIRTIVFI